MSNSNFVTAPLLSLLDKPPSRFRSLGTSWPGLLRWFLIEGSYHDREIKIEYDPGKRNRSFLYLATRCSIQESFDILPKTWKITLRLSSEVEVPELDEMYSFVCADSNLFRRWALHPRVSSLLRSFNERDDFKFYSLKLSDGDLNLVLRVRESVKKSLQREKIQRLLDDMICFALEAEQIWPFADIARKPAKQKKFFQLDTNRERNRTVKDAKFLNVMFLLIVMLALLFGLGYAARFIF